VKQRDKANSERFVLVNCLFLKRECGVVGRCTSEEDIQQDNTGEARPDGVVELGVRFAFLSNSCLIFLSDAGSGCGTFGRSLIVQRALYRASEREGRRKCGGGEVDGRISANDSERRVMFWLSWNGA
jgi:hypothetical protein